MKPQLLTIFFWMQSTHPPPTPNRNRASNSELLNNPAKQGRNLPGVNVLSWKNPRAAHTQKKTGQQGKECLD